VAAPRTDKKEIFAAAGKTYEAPTLVMFGATDWRKTKPSGAHVLVHTHALFCSPCLKRTCWRDTPVECMSLLAPQKIRALLLMLAS